MPPTSAARSRGLTGVEAARRRDADGPNLIERGERPSALRELSVQLAHPLALLLWVAATLAFATGTTQLGWAIVIVILINAAFAFAQERQAERATEALAQLLPPQVRALRDGEVVEIPAPEVVAGDVILVSEGDRISADARLLSGGVKVDLSPLTGESHPVQRTAGPHPPAERPVDAPDMLFAGALCTEGEATALVEATGMRTEIGRIAALSQRVRPEPSPLQLQVGRAARLIAAVAIGMGVAFFAIGILIAGLPTASAATFAIGLLVANVPEGLLPTITLALAVGVRRMARRGALVKRLAAVETLGSTDVICTDKTGTLTEGHMALVALWTPSAQLDLRAGEPGPLDPALTALLHDAVRCTTAHWAADGDSHGDQTEVALLAGAQRLGVDAVGAQADRPQVRRALLAFDVGRKRMSTIDEEPTGGTWLHAKGAPLELLGRCTRIATGDGAGRPLSADDRAAVGLAADRLAADGLRVLALAQRLMTPGASTDEDRDAVESGLTLLGLAAMEDPPRRDVRAAVAACRQAGIRIIVITGDHGLTAEAVAREIGIFDDVPHVIAGAEVERLDDERLDGLLGDPRGLIVARSTPETKLRIVDALRREGRTVAMTGDGVNDAPALRRADIGIAMGASGTDVAREAATMVLTDDSFASIVEAVREGRTVYENIRKFIVYIFAHAPPEVVPFLLYALAGGAIPLPITALQILAIDLGTDTLPALALGREPAEPGIMLQAPRPRSTGIITRPMLTRAWLRIGMLEALLVTCGFFFVLLRGGWTWNAPTGAGTPLHQLYLTATTMTFAGIIACQVGAAFAARTSRASLRSIGVFTNRMLLWAIAFELAFAAAVIWLPPLQSVFATSGLAAEDLALLAVFPPLVWGSDELYRAWLRRRSTPAAPEPSAASG